MSIIDIVADDGNVEALRMALINIKSTLQDASYDYSRIALEAANETLKAVHSADPCGTVWPRMRDFQKYSQKAQAAMNATTQVTGMLLMVEETGNEDIDDMNQDVKVTSMELHVAASMLEGAHTRMNHAMPGIPNNGVSGERCNPKALTPTPEKGNG